MASASRTEICNRSRLAELASRPDVTVYEYTNDVAEDIMPPDEQLYVYRAIVAGFDGGVMAHPGADAEAIRERILDASPKARKFQNLYPKVFASVTAIVRNSAEEERLDRIRKAVMLMMIEKVQANGSEDEVAARVMHHSLRLAMRDTTEEDRSSGTVLGPGDRPDGAPEMVPMHPSELGASSVKQTY
jgi:hypothetical protein